MTHRFAIIVPSTNTMVETDCWTLRAERTSFHTGRMLIRNPVLDSDAAFERLLDEVDAAFEAAAESVLTANPHHLIMGMSAPTFWGGADGARNFRARAEGVTGLPVTLGSEAMRDALRSVNANRIAILTPYPAIMRAQITRYFEDEGFDVRAFVDLHCESATAIADVTDSVLREAVSELDVDEIDAIVQAGTNLPMISLLERSDLGDRLGNRHPLLPINAVTLAQAYRAERVALPPVLQKLAPFADGLSP
ncbi:MAG: arylmalonate decarboxylase [Pseudomonadota bacterium]